MKKSEISERIQSIGQAETIEDVRAQLATFQTEIETDYDGFEQATQQITTLEQANENLRQANMNLFLQVGQQTQKTTENKGTETPPAKREFKNLFDEKGGLK